MVLVFKTNVSNKRKVRQLGPALDALERLSRWNFDLQDCDNILRIESPEDISADVVGLLDSNGFLCEVLE